ncbi:nucleotidyl transferase AbiEii/AbiGii toxin family protein [Legionella sainthelensi]|uniref:nucleotidyl transferase AbiEii/AbiGii toxin family protein n=1 Tax=Legionella sainthelensi TaxID=28087 RepID=UPI000E205932|nr:nucleotidyl transferase AbiEii/AbiGii toxin family protein [Legionella sainthelensi]
MTKNIGESIRSRLKNIAVKEGSDFNGVLTRYGLERLLYRIGESEYSKQFLLKGALLFNLWYDMPHRPTKDIDLLGFGDNDLAYIKQTFSKICSISADDGISFLSESVTVDTIKKDGGYTGARVELFGELAKAKIKIQIDIGYGDAVTPGPIDAHYHVLLTDLPVPKILTYPIYTVIAEKLHAIALLGMANSRLKDYLDLYVLLSNEQIDNQVLAKAIQATFNRRGMDLPEALPIGLTDEFANDPSRESMWKAFLRKNELEQRSLVEVISRISALIQSPMSLATKAVSQGNTI